MKLLEYLRQWICGKLPQHDRDDDPQRQALSEEYERDLSRIHQLEMEVEVRGRRH